MPALSLAITTVMSILTFTTSGISDCGTNPVFSISSQSFSPTSPVAGDNVSWTITYKVPAVAPIESAYSINSGTVNGFIPIDPTKSDLCGVVDCPIVEGEYTTTNYQVWPDGLAGSKIALVSQWVDDANNELLCSKVVVTGKQALRGRVGGGV